MTTKISPQMLASLYPDTKFAGVKRTLAKVKNNVEKSTAETNLAINTIEKTFQTKMKLMSTLSGELSGYKDAKEGGFEGGVLKWITASPETQKIFIQKKYDPNTIIPETSNKDKKIKAKGLFGGPDKSQTEMNTPSLFNNDTSNKIENNLAELGEPTYLNDSIEKESENINLNMEDIGSIPTLDEILASKNQSQAIIDNSTNDDERRKAQNNIDVIDNLYSNMDGLDSFDLEELYG
tara:strand:+ start:542 stop:1249 length:708 start_codon:yes stop_codon:yes gene_type:complete